MAGIAFDRLVSVNQTIIRQIMIESLTIKLHDVRVSAFVFAMASPALTIQGVRLSAVKTSMCFPISCNFLMAIKA
jgi:hypothetical protein